MAAWLTPAGPCLTWSGQGTATELPLVWLHCWARTFENIAKPRVAAMTMHTIAENGEHPHQFVSDDLIFLLLPCRASGIVPLLRLMSNEKRDMCSSSCEELEIRDKTRTMLVGGNSIYRNRRFACGRGSSSGGRESSSRTSNLSSFSRQRLRLGERGRRGRSVGHRHRVHLSPVVTSRRPWHPRRGRARRPPRPRRAAVRPAARGTGPPRRRRTSRRLGAAG